MFPVLLFHSPQWNIFLASSVVLATGILDDYYELNRVLYVFLGEKNTGETLFDFSQKWRRKRKE